MNLLVIAKAPSPGRVKTRLCPPCTPDEAAGIAAAALEDTLRVVRDVRATRHVLVLDGEPGSWLPAGFEVLPQRGAGLATRIAAAFEDAGGPALLIGMDTPQVRSGMLVDALARLGERDTDAVLGPALDGGWWAMGLRSPDPEVFRDVPMSVPTTCAAQRARLRSLGLRVAPLRPMCDVDHFDDAREIAAAVPGSRFAAAVGGVVERLELEAGRTGGSLVEVP